MTWRTYCHDTSLGRYADVEAAKELLEFHVRACPVRPFVTTEWNYLTEWRYLEEFRSWRVYMGGEWLDHDIRPSMKRSDIDDQHVIDLAQASRGLLSTEPGVIAALMREGVPRNLAYTKVMHMVERGLLDYGVSPNYAWPTGRRLA